MSTLLAFLVFAAFVALVLYVRSNPKVFGPKSSAAVELTHRLNRVRYMSGPQFERFVADIMRGLGYRVKVLGGSGDQGVDVIATAADERLAIQCKNYKKPVGNKPVQEVYAGARHHRCSAAWVVAPQGFTKGARELARSVGVRLYDTRSLREWINQIDRRARKAATSEPRAVDLDETDRRGRETSTLKPHAKDLDAVDGSMRTQAESGGTMGRGFEKHTVKVGGTEPGSNVGETVSFTAECLGTAKVNGGAEAGSGDFTFYRLPDGTFRVLIEFGTTAVLYPSNMEEAMRNGQRNNWSYGRMTLEEMKAEKEYQIGEFYEAFWAKHPENIKNTVRDID